MHTYGSGQTSGLPLAVTAVAQTLHTAPSGSSTPHRCVVSVTGIISGSVSLQICNSSGVVQQTLVKSAGDPSPQFPSLTLNGGSILKVLATVGAQGTIQASADIDDQSAVAGCLSVPLSSGLVAAVQNASRFAMGAQGGTGQATRANAEHVMPRAGVLRNLYAVADATIGGGCTVTV
jgi:hypothetical protein